MAWTEYGSIVEKNFMKIRISAANSKADEKIEEQKKLSELSKYKDFITLLSPPEIETVLTNNIISLELLKFADSKNESLLVFALKMNKNADTQDLKNMILKFIEMGADSRAIDREGDSLITSVSSDDNINIDIMKFLLELYLKEFKDNDFYSLQTVIKLNQFDLIKFVCEKIDFDFSELDKLREIICSQIINGKSEIAHELMKLLPSKKSCKNKDSVSLSD